MIWQDWVLSGAGLFFFLALVAMVRDPKARVSPLAAYITGAGVFTVGTAYATLGLWFSAAVQIAASFLWFYFGCTKGTK